MKKKFPAILFLLCLACSGSLDLPPSDGVNPNGNPGATNSGALTQTLVFQGAADVALQNAEIWDVPLPAAAVEARLYVFGHLFTTLYYTEIGEHGHAGVAGTTTIISHSHQALVYANNYVLGGLGFGGNASLTLNGQCGQYVDVSQGNPGCTNKKLIDLSQHQHAHDFVPLVAASGVAGLDADGNVLVPSSVQKTYLDQLQVLVDGEDVTGNFDLAPLGDGSAGHELNGEGAVADLSAQFAQAGHHRITFRINGTGSSVSQGGRLNYVLWLRIPLGPWPSAGLTP